MADAEAATREGFEKGERLAERPGAQKSAAAPQPITGGGSVLQDPGTAQLGQTVVEQVGSTKAAEGQFPEMSPKAALLAQKHDLSNPAKRAELVRQVREIEDAEMAATRAKAARLGVPMVMEMQDGAKAFLVGFTGDQPEYLRDENVNAAISTTANLVRSTLPYQVDGTGLIFGLWEAGGIPRVSHQEFGTPTKVTVRDSGTTVTDHATHVGGTMAGLGTNPVLKGMAPGAKIHAYDATNDLSEMLAAGAATAGETGKIYISNHSYGYARGWDGNVWLGTFIDDGNPANDIDTRCGRYDSTSVSFDGMLYNVPHYLAFFSAGNARNDGPPSTGATWYYGSTARAYDPAQHPVGNAAYKAGFDLLDMQKGCKNIMTVGAANDAVSAGVRSLTSSTLTTFSSTGPTDDGRIKPDIVANGASLLSAVSTSDTAMGYFSGTSMAAPNASGSAMLLVDYYQKRFPGQAMRASTLKGLIIHTADDIGRAGPDYEYGWGLMNTKTAADLIKLQADQPGNENLTEAVLASGGSQNYPFLWDGVSPIRVTLCWTDPAGAPSSTHDNRTPDLTNDLNVKVIAPGGGTHLPFVMPYVGDWTNAKLTALATTGVNTVDNVEQVLISAPPVAGQYVVTVNHAGNLTHGEQAYSLIISGGQWLNVLQVSPAEGLESTGVAGGPFIPATKVYSLANVTGSPIQWTAAVDQGWVSVSPASGTLAVGGSVNVTVSLTAAANTLPGGVHEATLNITDVTAGNLVMSREVELRASGVVPGIVVEGPEGTVLVSGGPAVSSGEVVLGADPKVLGFTVKNSVPGVALEMGDITLTGDDADSFSVSALSSTQPLSLGDSAMFSATFRPRRTGAHAAVMQIASNAAGSPFRVNLTGLGKASVGLEQSILAEESGPRYVTDGPFSLGAYATSGLPLEYTVLSGPVTVNATGLITPTGTTGPVTLRIRQPGGNGYGEVEVYRTFAVSPALGFVKVFTGANSNTSYAIKSNGTLWSWGNSGSIYLLGENSGSRVTPGQVGSFTNWASIAVGISHVLGLRQDGSLYAWGSGSSGQIGNGSNSTQMTPNQIQIGKSWSAVSVGSNFSAAIRSDGTLWTWGGNQYGQLGSGNTTTTSMPTQVGTATDWKSVSCGDSNILAIKGTGELWAWGLNTSGQLGTGNTTQATSPVRVGNDSDWAQVDAGHFHALAIKKDGSLWSWGSGAFDTLGHGDTTMRTAPTRIGLETGWRDISAGRYFSSARKTTGELWVWGYNDSGALADGTVTRMTIPTLVAGRSDWADMGCGAEHLLALDSQGMIWVSGTGGGHSGAAPRSLAWGASVPGAWKQVTGGISTFAAIRSDGSLWTWGRNVGGSVGGGDLSTSSSRWVPTRLGSDYDWTKVSGGSAYSTMALKTDGSLWGWGSNSSGMLGDGTTTSQGSPVQIGTGWADVSAGTQHTMGVRTDGTLWGWGSNISGKLGNGVTSGTQTTPEKIGTATNWRRVSSGPNHTNAIKTDGTLWGWGANTAGVVGDGSTTLRTTPVQAGSAANWDMVSAGTDHVLALKTDGSLWSWGSNAYGQLGHGTKTSSSLPVRVGTATDWVQVLAGNQCSVAIKTDGSLWSTGRGNYGQLGNASTKESLVFVKIGTDRQYLSIALGDNNLVALRKDGSFWSAGTARGFQLMAGGRNSRRQVPILPALAPQTIQPPAATWSSWQKVSVFGTSGLPAAVQVVSGPAMADGNRVTFTGGGTVVISASQFGDEQVWDAAPPEEFTLTVAGHLAISLTTANSVGATLNGFNATGVDLNVTLGFAPNVWDRVTLINNTGSGPVIGELPGVPQNGYLYLTNGGVLYGFRVNYQGGDGNDITLTHEVAPEVIDFPEITPKAISDAPFAHKVRSSSGRPVELEVLQGLVYVSGDNIHLMNSPTGVTIRATLPGNAQFQPAEPVVRTFVVTDKAFRFADIAVGKTTSAQMAIDSNGGVWTWGYGGYGQLGTGAISSLYSPQKMGAATWTKVAMGGNHSVGIQTDGTLWAWGNNSSYQIGDGTTTQRYTPVQIGSANNWSMVEAGVSHTLALRTDGSLWSWGANNYYQIGDNTTTTRSTPTRVGTDSDWAMVSVGAYSNLALKNNGTLWAWGYNAQGQAGVGSYTNQPVPVQIGGGFTWKAISAGGYHSLAVREDGTLWAWGHGGYGQLGAGNVSFRQLPGQVGADSNWVSVEAGIYHSMAVKSDGSVWCWGMNNGGQLGNGTLNNQLTPQLMSGPGSDFAILQAGTACTMVLKTDGSLYTVGDGGGYTGKSNRKLTRALPTETWSGFSSMNDHTLLTKPDGSLWAYGSGAYGKLGQGSSNTLDQNLIRVGTGTAWQQAWTGFEHSAAIRNDGSLWMCGQNTSGQIGDGTTVTKLELTQIIPGSMWRSLSLNTTHTLAIRSNGSLWSWGGNNNGQLGEGTTTQRNFPVQVGTDTDWLIVAAGVQHSLGVKTNGSLWGWGSNNGGRLGVGDTTDRLVPVQVGTDTNWTQIVAGSASSYGIKSDGSLWAWGINSSGQLGLGDTATRTVPTRVGNGNDWQQISGGYTGVAAIKKDGTLWVWASNHTSQLGLGSGGNVLTPRQVGSSRSWVRVEAGSYHITGMQADGSLWTGGFTGSLRLTPNSGRSPFILAPVVPALVEQSITPHDPGASSGTVKASSGLPVKLELVSGSATIEGDHITHTGAIGSKVVYLAWQPGDETAWDAVVPMEFSITTQDIDFAAIPEQKCGTPLVLSATASSGLPVTYFITSGVGIVNRQGDSLNFTASGSVTIVAVQGGNGSFAAAQAVSRTFNVVKEDQTIAFAAGIPESVSHTQKVALSATSSQGLTPVTFSVFSGPGNVSGNELSFTAPGTVVVHASQAGNLAFNPGLGSKVITASNTAPVAVAGAAQGTEDALILGSVSATDADGSPLTYAKVRNPANGTLTLQPSGSYSYLPGLNFNGVDSFTFQANDGLADSNVATVTLTVQAVNDAPIATTQHIVTADSIAKAFTLAGSDVDADDLTFSVMTLPQQGTLTGVPPLLTYVSNPGYHGADALSYKVNDGQADSAVVTITLQVNPVLATIQQAPISQNVSETNEVTFSVTAMGTLPLNYQWMRGETVLEGETNPILNLTDVELAEAGFYKVRITNPAGTVTSEVAELRVIGGKPEIQSQPIHQLAAVNTEVVMEVTAEGTPPLEYQWQFKGKDIKGATVRRFTIPNVQLKDAGAYTVVVKAASETTSVVAELGVAEDPRLSLAVAEGKATAMTLKTAGAGLTLAWRKDSSPLITSDGMTLTSDLKKLSFKAVQMQDAGVYTCEVSGPGGLLIAGTHELFVIDGPPDITPLKSGDALPPTIIGDEYVYEVPVDENVQRRPASFTAKGLPKGLAIDATTGVISGSPTLSKSASFPVKITAKNSSGSDTVDVTLKVNPLPDGAVGVFVCPVPRHALNEDLGGRLDITTTTAGSFSGKLTLGNRTAVSLKGGQLRTSLEAGSLLQGSVRVIQSGDLPPLELTFRVQPETGLIPSATLSDGVRSVDFDGWKNIWDKTNNPANAADGLYNLGLELSGDAVGQSAVPQGQGYAAFTLLSAGTMKLTGKTADGEGITGSAFMGPQGQILIFQPLYKTTPKGSLIGSLRVDLEDDLSNDIDNTVSGLVSWLRPASTARAYAAGFGPVELEAVGQRYVAPASDQILLGLPDQEGNAILEFTGAGIDAAELDPDLVFRISSKNAVVLPKAGSEANATKLKCKITAKTGLVTGSFTLEDADPSGGSKRLKRVVTFQGLMPASSAGSGAYGYFLLPRLPATPGEKPTATPMDSGLMTLEAP